jgi:hypothetical protein
LVLLGNRQDRAVQIATIVPVLALSHQTGVTLAEVGFLLILFAGVWLVAAQIPAFLLRPVIATIPLEDEDRVTILQSLELVCAEVLMLLAIGHDHAKLVRVAIDGLPIPVQGTTIQDCLLLEIAAGAGGHSAILTPLPPQPQRLSPIAG